MKTVHQLTATVAGLALLVVGAAAQTMKINGAGATFPYPIYSKWFSEYNKLHKDVQINYQSIGSGGGIRQLTQRRDQVINLSGVGLITRIAKGDKIELPRYCSLAL